MNNATIKSNMNAKEIVLNVNKTNFKLNEPFLKAISSLFSGLTNFTLKSQIEAKSIELIDFGKLALKTSETYATNNASQIAKTQNSLKYASAILLATISSSTVTSIGLSLNDKNDKRIKHEIFLSSLTDGTRKFLPEALKIALAITSFAYTKYATKAVKVVIDATISSLNAIKKVNNKKQTKIEAIEQIVQDTILSLASAVSSTIASTIAPDVTNKVLNSLGFVNSSEIGITEFFITTAPYIVSGIFEALATYFVDMFFKWIFSKYRKLLKRKNQ